MTAGTTTAGDSLSQSPTAASPTFPQLVEADHGELTLTVWRYLSVGLIAGAVIALQIAIMRLYAVGSWAHFGSLVVSLAMLGFGLASAIMTVARSLFEQHWRFLSMAMLLALGPVMVVTNLTAQQLPFNAIFLVSDPAQKWLLLANYILYFIPFLVAAFFLGIVFNQSKKGFSWIYAADLLGAGIGGLLMLPAMYVLHPRDLIVLPLVIWLAGALCWVMPARLRLVAGVAVLGLAAIFGHLYLPAALGLKKLAVSDYKGVSYARKFPDARRLYQRETPNGLVEIYGSSYLHFAPGLSDNASLNLTSFPADAYLGLYVDGDGPAGVMAKLPEQQTGYFRYLPMVYPYLIKQDPSVFVVQLNGGISTWVALREGARSVSVAEANPAVLAALRDDPAIRRFTGDVLRDPRVSVIGEEGRLYLAYGPKKFDVIDFSLADSTGLSSPGGFAVIEKFAYTREAMLSYMRALNPGGVLSVTVWNKEEPPKSVPKLYTTIAAAAIADAGRAAMTKSVFVASSYLNTTTVLYKRGGFTADEIAKLRAETDSLSFDQIYYPGMPFDAARERTVLKGLNAQIFSDADAADPTANNTPDAGAGAGGSDDQPVIEPATAFGRVVWAELVRGRWDRLRSGYVFDTSPLTNARPYFSGYVRPGDLPRVLDRLELLQDDWGYLLLWATLIVAVCCAVPLVLVPLIAGWRTLFSSIPGKLGTILYFACLGLGYIMVEVGLIAYFVLALTNPTISVTLLITFTLIFSGIGSLVSARFFGSSRRTLPIVLAMIVGLLLLYAANLGPLLNAIGGLPYPLRLTACVTLLAPLAFLMGFPMATGINALERSGRHAMFIWAWGVNGCFSVIGSALVPLVSITVGLPSVLLVAATAYLLAIVGAWRMMRGERAPAREELPDAVPAAA